MIITNHNFLIYTVHKLSKRNDKDNNKSHQQLKQQRQNKLFFLNHLL